MASQTRMSAREEERRLNMRTLVIASSASATAAVITSQLWVAGTWIAAALTPVIVAVVSELLHRPTAVIAKRVTSKSGAILPQAAGAGTPPRRGEPELSSRAPAEPGSGPEPAAPPVRMYRSGSGNKRSGATRRAPGTKPSRRKVAIGVVAVTAALAFAISAIAITGTELVTGGSIGKGQRDTTLFGGGRDEANEEQAPQDGQSAPAQGEEQQEQGPSQPEQGGDQQPQPDEPPGQAEPAPQAPETPAPVQP